MTSNAGPNGPCVSRRMAKALPRRAAAVARGLSKLMGLMGVVGLSVAALPSAAAPAQERLLVWARAGLSEQEISRGLAPYRVGRQRMGRQGWHVVTMPAGLRAAEMQRRLHAHPMFQQVEVDRLHPLGQALNDTFAGSLWHLTRLSVPPAWAVASGMGRGVTVAVLDTGVQPDHPDLYGVLVPGWNVVDSSSNTSDGHGHGTSVVGLLAARINNGQGVAGMASGARIMPIRVTQADGNARTSDIALGIQRAAEQGARVINISFEGVMGSAAIRAAAQSFYRQGGLVVVAAGNRGVEDTYAAQPGMVVVGALDERDSRPAWASYGAHLALAAPGDGLWTTGLGGGYRVVWGTSFAAPLVTAVAALMWETAPQASPAQVEQWLRETAVDLGVPGPDTQFGSGRLQAAAAVAAARRWQLSQTPGVAGAGAGGAASTGNPNPATGSAPMATGGTATTTLNTQSPADPVGAWLGLDVDASAAPTVARVQVWVGERLVLTDMDPPFAFALNLTEHPRGLLRLRLVGLDGAGVEVGGATVELQNNHMSATASPARLLPISADALGPRPGTGWAALRRTGSARGRQ